jgi:hypothetical protein
MRRCVGPIALRVKTPPDSNCADVGVLETQKAMMTVAAAIGMLTPGWKASSITTGVTACYK